MTIGQSIERIDVPKSCDLLAAQLRRQILNGVFAAGALLPPERDLVEQSGLSRGSVREALRILEAEGLVRTRAGRYGGSLVCQPSDDLLARHIEMFVKGRSVSLASLIDTREGIEPTVARLAALNRTDDDLQALSDIATRLEAAAPDDVVRFAEENVHWHYALAVASHNDLLRAIVASLTGLIQEAGQIEAVIPPDVREQVVKAHRRIYEAIVAGDGDAARRRMERHLGAYSRRAAEVLPAVEAGAAP